MILDDKLMKYVVFKKRTENEVRQKCRTLNYDENYITEIIDYLKEYKYIDDENYIDKYIKNIMRLKHLSINEIKMDLMRRGISTDLIEKYITDELMEYEIDSAKILAEKKLKTMDKEKVRRYLSNKGYSYANITKAIDNCEDLEDN